MIFLLNTRQRCLVLRFKLFSPTSLWHIILIGSGLYWVAYYTTEFTKTSSFKEYIQIICGFSGFQINIMIQRT